MRLETDEIKIVLKKREIEPLWNVIMFALDYDAINHKMSQAEETIARELEKVLDKMK